MAHVFPGTSAPPWKLSQPFWSQPANELGPAMTKYLEILRVNCPPELLQPFQRGIESHSGPGGSIGEQIHVKRGEVAQDHSDSEDNQELLDILTDPVLMSLVQQLERVQSQIASRNEADSEDNLA